MAPGASDIAQVILYKYPLPFVLAELHAYVAVPPDTIVADLVQFTYILAVNAGGVVPG